MKSLQLMIGAIDDYSLLTNGKNWNLNTNSESIFEDVFGVKYAEVENSEKMPIYELSDDILTNFNRLSNVLITNVDFVITQELYIGSQLLNDMEELKLNDTFKLLKSLSSYKHITAEKFIQLYNMIIIIKQKINNYL